MTRRPPRSTLCPNTTLFRSIFPRTAKTVPPSSEVRSRLDVEEEFLTPDELVRAILRAPVDLLWKDRKSTRLNSSHANISYAVFCLTKKPQPADGCTPGAAET